ncbi:hypothetical protein AAFF_G00193950 [Aldrovandia affinis]|uniref:Uncharacterized protein n=1 Tax=Aldrovandia affinis TaxID=143900 RepID=A0AAD7SXF7_9TELE|nr:hypothetical protein AAFF_G00193950 [Aldrovandia affinis]
MATNIELIFRDFVMNKIREIEDEGQHSGITSGGHSNGGVPLSVENKGPGGKVTDGMESQGETRIESGPSEPMECPKHSQLEAARVSENTATVKDLASKEEGEAPRKKNKKHKRHKSKKKKKKRKEEKGSSSESGLESDGETRNQPSVKNEVTANIEGRGVDHAGTAGEEGEGRTKREKRHMAKKKKKRRRREEEKLERKSPAHSQSGSTSISGAESEMENEPVSRLLPTMSPVVSLDKLKERASPVTCPATQVVIASPSTKVVTVKCKSVSGEDCRDFSAERKYFLTVKDVAAEHEGNQETFCKTQDLPDIVPKRESTHKEGIAKEELDISTEINRKQDRKGEKGCGRSSRSQSRSRSLSQLKRTSHQVPMKKSHSRSSSPKQHAGKSGSKSGKCYSTSRRRSRSASKRKNSPKRKRSRSHSGRRKSRSQSFRKFGRKSRSHSAKRRQCSKSRDKRSKSPSRHSHSRSRSRRSRSRHRSQRSRSVRRTRRSQSRHRRSRSRSIRRTRRTRSRSIVILKQSWSRRNRRSTSVQRRRSRTGSPKRRQSKSQSPQRSRRSKSRSTATQRRSKSTSRRRNRSKSRSLQRRKHVRSRSPERCNRSKSKSPKYSNKRSKSPKRRKHSKSRSPGRNESKSRSVSKDGQLSERKSSPTKLEVGSHSKSEHGAGLTSPEKEVKRVSPERTDEVEDTSEETCSQSVIPGHSLKEETPLDFASHETGQVSALCVEHSTDCSQKDVPPMGPWKPVPLLVDGKMSPKLFPIQEVVSSASEGQAVVMNPCENRSPLNGEDQKYFTAETPLHKLECSELTASYTASGDTQSTLTSEIVSEDGDKRIECRSPQRDSERLTESLENLEESIIVERKTERDILSPHDHGSSRSRSLSPSTEEKPLVTKDGKSQLQSKNPKSSKQRPSSKSPVQKKDSRSPSRKSRSPSSRKRSRSISSHRKRSQTKSTTQKKSKSKSPTKGRKSRSPSRNRKKKSRSKSPLRKIRSRSKSAARKRKSHSRSKIRTKRSQSKSPKRRRSKSSLPSRKKRSKSRSPARRRRSKSADKSKRSKSRSPARRRRSRSRARRSRSKMSLSSPRRRRSGFPLDRRDRWKRTPSHSPILILRKRRSTSRPRRSTSKTPPRLTELDKDQLLEIAKANAAAMCAKAGVPIPESLRPKAILQLPLPSPIPTSLSLPLSMNLPMNLSMGMANMPNIAISAAVATMNAALSTMSVFTSMPAMPALPTITNKPPPSAIPNTANIEEVKRKVTQKANSISIKELTEKCKKIAESKEEMAIAKPHVSDDEDDEKPFAGAGLKETKGITFSLSNSSAKPVARTEAAFAKEFPVSSGSQHRKKEGDGVYGEWVPVDKKTEKSAATTATAVEEEGKDSDSVFPDAPLQPVDITLAVSERAVAQKRLAENPFDVNAICMLSRAQEQVDAWAQSNTIPGLFTGSTGAQVLSSEELSTSGPQAWIKKRGWEEEESTPDDPPTTSTCIWTGWAPTEGSVAPRALRLAPGAPVSLTLNVIKFSAPSTPKESPVAPSVLIRCTAVDGGPRTSSCVLRPSLVVWASS